MVKIVNQPCVSSLVVENKKYRVYVDKWEENMQTYLTVIEVTTRRN